MKSLTRLVYRSDSCISHDDTAALDEIFRVSLRNNARDGLTGALALPDGKFIQAIEGEQAPLEALMARLQADDRHTNITMLGSWPITARLFRGWAMARPDPTPLGEQAFRIATDVGSGAQVAGLLIDLVETAPKSGMFSLTEMR
tara:strand:- start:31 stop:462 length:432 start_codon:yes stop_codon:yes gene_type:complete